VLLYSHTDPDSGDVWGAGSAETANTMPAKPAKKRAAFQLAKVCLVSHPHVVTFHICFNMIPYLLGPSLHAYFQDSQDVQAHFVALVCGSLTSKAMGQVYDTVRTK
jgi:hypothetical protein